MALALPSQGPRFEIQMTKVSSKERRALREREFAFSAQRKRMLLTFAGAYRTRAPS